MQLAYRFYPCVTNNNALRPKPHTLVVCMHGFLGSNANWGAQCSFLSGRMIDEGQALCAYPALAYDFRNHGDSFHSPEHNFDVHRNDLRDLLRAINVDDTNETRVIRGGAEPPASAAGASDFKIVLVAHSMGGMLLMDYLWRFHRRGATSEGGGHEEDGLKDDRVVGAVIVDVAPFTRPEWFYRLRDDLQVLKDLPATQMTTHSEAEQWVKKHANPSLAANTWMIKYLLTNLERRPHAIHGALDAAPTAAESPYANVGAIVPVDAHKRETLQWKCNLNVLIDNIDKTLWAHDAPRDTSGGSLVTLPTLHVFGEMSPYRSTESLAAIPKFFGNADVRTVLGAGHFVHIEKRRAFTDLLRAFLAKVS